MDIYHIIVLFVSFLYTADAITTTITTTVYIHTL